MLSQYRNREKPPVTTTGYREAMVMVYRFGAVAPAIVKTTGF
jgi:hypothetical protein